MTADVIALAWFGGLLLGFVGAALIDRWLL